MTPRAAAVLAGLLAAAMAGRADETPPLPCAPTAGPAVEAVSEGTHVRREPDGGSTSVAVVDVDMNLPVLTRCGGWVRVRYLEWKGWVWTGHGDAPRVRGSRLKPPLPDQASLDLARGLLAGRAAERAFGPYTFLTDVRDEGLLARFGRTAAALSEIHAARYGARALPTAGAVIVVFGREADYRTYERSAEGVAGLGARGHAGGGLAALTIDNLDADEATALVVHEVAHMLNRAALGPDLPPWLDEGIAEDMAFSRFGPSGALVPGTWRSRRFVSTWIAKDSNGRDVNVVKTSISGPGVTAADLVRRGREGTLPSLELLVSLSYPDFVSVEARPVTYPMSCLLVRYLLEVHAAAFHAFLATVAAGGTEEGLDLFAGLCQDAQTLEKGFKAWLPALWLDP